MISLVPFDSHPGAAVFSSACSTCCQFGFFHFLFSIEHSRHFLQGIEVWPSFCTGSTRSLRTLFWVLVLLGIVPRFESKKWEQGIAIRYGGSFVSPLVWCEFLEFPTRTSKMRDLLSLSFCDSWIVQSCDSTKGAELWPLGRVPLQDLTGAKGMPWGRVGSAAFLVSKIASQGATGQS